MESQFIFGGLGAFIMGVSLGIFGAGGSIMTVPLLVYLFQFAPLQATHLSLLVVGAVSALGIYLDKKSDKLPLAHLAKFVLPAMLGMYVARKKLLPMFPQQIFVFGQNYISLDNLLMIVFALFMLAAAGSMIFVRIDKPRDLSQTNNGRPVLLAAMGLLVGLITGLIGAGGGFLIVPALVFFAGFSFKEATRASLFVIMLNSMWGFFVSLDSDALPWRVLAIVVTAAFFGMLLGLKVKANTSSDKLKPAFGVFILLMGSYVLWRAI
jgi:uncharacterized membrane protein YfcA